MYLDEILEFRKETLETLRGPLEDKEVTISRLWASLTYPCNFMLIASMNPCPCGYYGSSIKNCICSPTSIKRYLSKLSGPLLDRIDINVNIQPLEYQNFKENEREFRLQSRRKARPASLFRPAPLSKVSPARRLLSARRSKIPSRRSLKREASAFSVRPVSERSTTGSLPISPETRFASALTTVI